MLNKWAVKGEAADRTGAGSVRMIFRARQLARVVPNLRSNFISRGVKLIGEAVRVRCYVIGLIKFSLPHVIGHLLLI